jgi:hypothetical protein
MIENERFCQSLIEMIEARRYFRRHPGSLDASFLSDRRPATAKIAPD